MQSSMTIKKIMSTTKSEFFRSLEHFAPNRDFDTSQTSFSFPANEGQAEISYRPLPDRKVTGLLSLPQMEVSIAFEGASDQAREAFMEAFDLAFRRGGG